MTKLIDCLRADVSYFLCCTRKIRDVPFPRATKEIGDVCTQATNWLINLIIDSATLHSQLWSSCKQSRSVSYLKSSLPASSAFGEVAGSHARAARERRRECAGRSLACSLAAHFLAIKYTESLLAQAAKVNLKSHDVTVMMVWSTEFWIMLIFYLSIFYLFPIY